MSPLTVSCVGKVNVDIFYSVDEININSNHVSNSTAFSLGGKAANVSVALKRLGIQTSLCSAIGDDEFGDFVLSKLRDYGVSPLFKEIFLISLLKYVFSYFFKKFLLPFLFQKSLSKILIILIFYL
ncbi:carbohydrate kinase family protein [Fervidobacterium gondwanense]|uniref:PfkB family carbohydrate kinase n=1 Tax=Fervidobacterium gondwanense DSM 13020 TaxID=1121883 RepID=A0A1M7TDV8_FERGO|nr:pfkB family carbohydrate kinase [Fervidobacterium gondwanense DSM 13020]